MAIKEITKKSFIGGRLVYPGDKVDVDAKGEFLPAQSTPIGNLTIEQLESILKAKHREAGDAEPVFSANVREPHDDDAAVQTLEIAPFRPVAPGAVRPQGLPPGTEQRGDTFVHPASEGAPAAIERVVPARSPLDHDGDGQPGGSLPSDPPGLAGKNKAQLLDIAKAESVEVGEGATNAEIVQAIEAKRAG